MTKDDPNSMASEAYRKIRSNIKFANEKLRKIIVTSSLPNEGRTGTVSNLAVVFAKEGNKILLIDSDLRNPKIADIFGIENKLGLTSVLAKKKNISECTRKTEVDNLWVLTSGPSVDNPSELLGSSEMKDFLDKCLDEFDMVFLDSPPLNKYTDAQVLAAVSDGVIMVVAAKSRAGEVLETKSLLQSVNANIIGAILRT